MKKIGVAVISASRRSTLILDYLKRCPEQGVGTGIYDLIPAAAELLLGHHECPDARAYDSLEQALTDEQVGAVFVNTPDFAHTAPVIAALKAGSMFIAKSRWPSPWPTVTRSSTPRRFLTPYSIWG